MMFDIDPSSALGSDGYMGSFYHFAWEVIGVDVCEPVRFFF